MYSLVYMYIELLFSKAADAVSDKVYAEMDDWIELSYK